MDKALLDILSVTPTCNSLVQTVFLNKNNQTSTPALKLFINILNTTKDSITRKYCLKFLLSFVDENCGQVIKLGILNSLLSFLSKSNCIESENLECGIGILQKIINEHALLKKPEYINIIDAFPVLLEKFKKSTKLKYIIGLVQGCVNDSEFFVNLFLKREYFRLLVNLMGYEEMLNMKMIILLMLCIAEKGKAHSCPIILNAHDIRKLLDVISNKMNYPESCIIDVLIILSTIIPSSSVTSEMPLIFLECEGIKRIKPFIHHTNPNANKSSIKLIAAVTNLDLNLRMDTRSFENLVSSLDMLRRKQSDNVTDSKVTLIPEINNGYSLADEIDKILSILRPTSNAATVIEKEDVPEIKKSSVKILHAPSKKITEKNISIQKKLVLLDKPSFKTRNIVHKKKIGIVIPKVLSEVTAVVDKPDTDEESTVRFIPYDPDSIKTVIGVNTILLLLKSPDFHIRFEAVSIIKKIVCGKHLSVEMIRMITVGLLDTLDDNVDLVSASCEVLAILASCSNPSYRNAMVECETLEKILRLINMTFDLPVLEKATEIIHKFSIDSSYSSKLWDLEAPRILSQLAQNTFGKIQSSVTKSFDLLSGYGDEDNKLEAHFMLVNSPWERLSGEWLVNPMNEEFSGACFGWLSKSEKRRKQSVVGSASVV